MSNRHKAQLPSDPTSAEVVLFRWVQQAIERRFRRLGGPAGWQVSSEEDLDYWRETELWLHESDDRVDPELVTLFALLTRYLAIKSGSWTNNSPEPPATPDDLRGTGSFRPDPDLWGAPQKARRRAFGAGLRQARLEEGILLDDAAIILGWTTSQLESIEQGEIAIDPIDALVLASAFGRRKDLMVEAGRGKGIPAWKGHAEDGPSENP